MKNKNILIVLPADDFNSEEYLLTRQTFKANGINVFISSDSNSLCNADNGIKVKPDISVFNIHTSNFSAVVFIGGDGIRKYWDNILFQKIATNFYSSKKIVGAICAAPIILARVGLLNNKNATCFPADIKEFQKGNVNYMDSGVIVDGNIVTGQSSENSVEFAQTIVGMLEF